ncbi:hypothetical protein EHI8A_012790 [Entamoeba histolytica HM-1:IMSS-B]|uniref:Uncharacterized protein n=1 Tax=Entamoeba histolytica HM-1:IMSS-B TaxID=885319 RepID=M3TGV2_ENTH1|nr:hypothetical protein EHI8A_012790 [Entamoeba histolytica HM-1:IMSS-B]
MTLNLPTQPLTFLKAVEFFGEYEDAIPLISDMKNDMKEFIQFVEESSCDTMASDVFYSIEHDLLTPEEVSNALIGFINKINNDVPIIANRIETIKKIIVLLKPIHLMSIYHYVALTNNNDVINVLKQIIDDLLMNGPVIQFVQENMVCLMDEE